ncbi:MAG: hypothetical protein ABIS35_10355 [Terracoccus sp.]
MSANGHLGHLGHRGDPVSLAPHEALARAVIRERTVGHGRGSRAETRRATGERSASASRSARHPRAAGLLRRWADRLDPRPVEPTTHRVEREPRPWAPVRRPASHRHS